MIVVRSFWEWREHTGLSLLELARRTGVQVGVLSDLERGKGRASTETLQCLAECYDVPVEALFELCPVPRGLQELLLRPGVRIPEGRVLRLCRLEFRSGQALGADDWARLSEELAADEGC